MTTHSGPVKKVPSVSRVSMEGPDTLRPSPGSVPAPSLSEILNLGERRVSCFC